MVNGNPQIEHGYTRIANELLEAISRANVTCGQMKIMLYAIRNSYGFGRKSCQTTYSKIANAVGISRRSVIRDVKKLENSKVVTYTSLANGLSLSINKHYGEWFRGDTHVTGDVGVTSDVQVTSASDVQVTDIRIKEKEKKYTPVVPKLSEVLTDIANAYREHARSCGKIREPSGWITTKSARVSNLKARMYEARLQVRESGNADSERIGNHPDRIVGLFRIYFRWLEDQQRDRMNQRDYTPNVGVTFDSAMRASGTWQKFLDLWETGGLELRDAA